VRGVEQVAWRAGYHVILCDTQGDLERERGYLEDMLAFQVEGVLIAPVGDRSRPQLRRLTRNNVPFVLVDRSIPDFDCDLVQGDSVAGGRQLVEHLIGLGHRRIGMITETSGVSTARDRLEGYRQAVEQAGLGFDPELVVESSAIDPEVAAEATQRLLALPDPPTAIFAVNNIAVVGVVEAARQQGLEIPGDLALVCFDDIEHVSRLYPFLTVMAQPAETYGTIATQLLLDRLNGRADQRRRIVVLPADFIVRKSSGAYLPAPAEA
jgi:LacI family transcriptional regulator, galactose operon repressor